MKETIFGNSTYLDDGLCRMNNSTIKSLKIWLGNQTETRGIGLVCYLGGEVE